MNFYDRVENMIGDTIKGASESNGIKISYNPNNGEFRFEATEGLLIENEARTVHNIYLKKINGEWQAGYSAYEPLAIFLKTIRERFGVKIIPHGGIATVNNYPYGSLKCTATFHIEFKPKFGFRHVFQTVNPKNNRLNAPKPGQYHLMDAIYLTQDENDFVTIKFIDFNKGFNNLAPSIKTFLSLREEIAYPSNVELYIGGQIISTLKINYGYDQKIPKSDENRTFFKNLIERISSSFRVKDWKMLQNCVDEIEDKVLEWYV